MPRKKRALSLVPSPSAEMLVLREASRLLREYAAMHVQAELLTAELRALVRSRFVISGEGHPYPSTRAA